MEDTLLQSKDNILNQTIASYPYYIVIEKVNNKKIKIPCVNESIAKKVLAFAMPLKLKPTVSK